MTETKMITIQPKLREDGVLPYPFHIQAEDAADVTRGAVGRQDFWHGTPSRLVGFQADPDVQAVDLTLTQFLAEPGKARGMHPVMQDSEGGWATYPGEIESVQAWTATENDEVFVKEPVSTGKEQ